MRIQNASAGLGVYAAQAALGSDYTECPPSVPHLYALNERIVSLRSFAFEIASRLETIADRVFAEPKDACSGQAAPGGIEKLEGSISALEFSLEGLRNALPEINEVTSRLSAL